jgi:pimeloyl-ACP methyl ester carboxylesterase
MCPPTIFAGLAELGRAPVTVAPWLEWQGDQDVDSLARSVRELVNPAEPAVLVGHSTGGLIALIAAALAGRAGGVPALVVCDTGAHTRGHGDVDAIIDRIERDWGPPLWRAFARRCVHLPPPSSVFDALADYPARLDRAAVVGVLRSQRDTDASPLLGRLDMPVLVVHGRHDQAREVGHAHELVAAVPDGELALLDCGHTPPVELPERFAATVRSWLGRVNVTG